jgi:Tfp pilus assembly protein PilZ
MASVRRDSRVHARAGLRAAVRATDPSKRVAGGMAFDSAEVTTGGAFLPSDVLLEIGEVLNLEIALPDGQIARAQARVVRVTKGGAAEPSGIGVEFTEITTDDRAAIERQLPQ